MYLICLGTILASVIFFNYRDEAITIVSHTQNVQYYARGEVLEGIQRDDTYMTGKMIKAVFRHHLKF